MNISTLWTRSASDQPDTHVALRGRFFLRRDARVAIRTLGASWYDAWLDGDWLTEGPLRFTAMFPEYNETSRELAAGEHVIAVQVHHHGVATRMLPDIPGFWWCQVLDGDDAVAVDWRAIELGGYRAGTRRVNPILGWIEWCDTRGVPADWPQVAFDDADWPAAIEVDIPIGEPQPPTVGDVGRFVHDLEPVARGHLANVFGGPLDDVSARFFLRGLDDPALPVEGIWLRYDLGRVRLGRMVLDLDLPAGTEVEMAYSEQLQHGRAAPYINWSCGPSCNLDHYISRGGRQTLGPMSPRGGRYVDVHILAPPEAVRVDKATFLERCYYSDPVGRMATGDAQLDRIWALGVDTLRACSEDAITDNPTRERGQWIGDSVSVGLEVGAVAYTDLRPFRRALVQAAQCANADGLVAGLCPGTNIWLASYACHWTCACVRYYELTGDRTLLETLHAAGVRNVRAFESHLTPAGLGEFSDWVFIDWGYAREDGATDVVFDMMYIAALRAMQRWNVLLGDSSDGGAIERLLRTMEDIVEQQLSGRLSGAGTSNACLNFHQAAWALRLGLLSRAQERVCVDQMKKHIAGCFPYDAKGPRMSDPFRTYERIFTPFFAHFVLPALAESGEMDFVLEVVRRCWGWVVDAGLTTLPEVFDTRWSHCHEWSGTPTWLLSRYLLGLNPRADRGPQHYDLRVIAGSLSSASGRLPMIGEDGLIEVAWKRSGSRILYHAAAPAPITLCVAEHCRGVSNRELGPAAEIEVEFESE